MSADSKLNVLHLDDGLEWRGGQHQVWLLATGLQKRGIRQSVMAETKGPLAQRLRDSEIAVIPYCGRGEWNFLAPRRLAEIVRESGYTILHAHTAHAHALALRSIRILRSADTKVKLVTTRRVDFAVGRGFFSRRKYTDPNQHFIAISQAVRSALIEGGVAPSRIDLVSSGVPPIPADTAWPREKVRHEFGIGEGVTAILSVGALTDHKDHRTLIRAARIVTQCRPDTRFYIFGEGELRRQLEDEIASLNLIEHVRLAGHIPNARTKLAGFDLYVSSSHLEGLGTAVLDAMLAERPVVACAGGGVTDYIHHGETGWLTPPKDPTSLADAIIKSLESTSDERGRIVHNARQLIEKNFSAEQMVAGTLSVYTRLLST